MGLNIYKNTTMTDPKEAAFPRPGSSVHAQEGLTKLEYFSAMALQGICANPNYWGDNEKEIADSAVTMAAALIEQLNK